MNQNKKIRLLLLPLIFIVLLHVPAMILAIAPNAFLLGGAVVFRNPCVLILCVSALIWCCLFYYIPIEVYIVILAVYTIVSWRWILRQKKGNTLYFIVWILLCVLSILMYWKWWELYHDMISG